MDLAAQRLRDSDDTVGVIGGSLGYTSPNTRSTARSPGTAASRPDATVPAAAFRQLAGNR
jgi:hypothetical protein